MKMFSCSPVVSRLVLCERSGATIHTTDGLMMNIKLRNATPSQGMSYPLDEAAVAGCPAHAAAASPVSSGEVVGSSHGGGCPMGFGANQQPSNVGIEVGTGAGGVGVSVGPGGNGGISISTGSVTKEAAKETASTRSR